MTLTDYLFWAVIALQVADAAITIHALRTGKTREANPIVAKLISKLGRDRAVVGLKIISIGALFYFRDQATLWPLVGLAALYAVVVVNNVRVIRKVDR